MSFFHILVGLYRKDSGSGAYAVLPFSKRVLSELAGHLCIKTSALIMVYAVDE